MITPNTWSRKLHTCLHNVYNTLLDNKAIFKVTCLQVRTNPCIPNDRRVSYLHFQINIPKENNNSQRRTELSFHIAIGYAHLKNYT